MRDFSKIKETVITFDNYRMNISSAGVWLDDLMEDGKTPFLSTAIAWEEMSEGQIAGYLEMYNKFNKSKESLAMTG